MVRLTPRAVGVAFAFLLVAGVESAFLVDADGDGLTDRAEFWGTSSTSSGVDPAGQTVDWRESDPRSADTDGDGLTDPRELDGPTSARNRDTDGDRLPDGWEVDEESDAGADLTGADSLHKDMFVHVGYLRGTEHELPPGVFHRVQRWYAEMPVRNPDGETGITVHVTDEERIGRSIDEWTKSNGETTQGVSGYMAMREFYNQEVMGPNTGSHFLVVMAAPDVPVRGHGNAGGSKTAIVQAWRGEYSSERTWAHTITHEMLHNVVRKIGGTDCNGRMHTCEGFLSYENDYYLSDRTRDKLNPEGFAPPVYREQMNATSCEATISDPPECGV